MIGKKADEKKNCPANKKEHAQHPGGTPPLRRSARKKHYAPIATPTRGWPPAGGVNTPYGKFCRGKSHVAGSYATQDGWSLPTAGEEEEEEEEAAIVFCFFVADMYTSQPMGRSCGYRDDIRSLESIKI